MPVTIISRSISYVSAGLCALILATAAAGAADTKKEKPEAKAWEVPSHIQLAPFMVPIDYHLQSATVVTFFLEATDRKDVGRICAYVPRIRDAIFQVLSRKPIPVKNRKLVLRNVPEQLLGPINEAFDRPMLDNIYVAAGAVRMGGGSISRLPFARINGCQTIRKKQDELRKAREAAKKG